jgi:glycosyltransferase involved in cell wall biosynthesis
LLLSYGLQEDSMTDLTLRSTRSGLRMVFYGQYIPRKGSLLLERVLPALGREYANAEVTFIAPAIDLPRIEAAYRPSFGSRLHALAWMSRSSAMEICRNNDILLFPSMLEGFGKTFLEGMACGLCVVGYAEGGLPDIALNEVEAFYCGAGDEQGFENLLRRCLQEPELARDAGVRAQSKALQYTWRRTAERLQDYCVERLKQKKGSFDEVSDTVAMV